MISANKEGIISIGGYFAIQVIGMFMGQEVYQTLVFDEPKKLRAILKTPQGQEMKARSEKKLFWKFIAYIVLFGIASELSNRVFGEPSRRLCNMSWVTFQAWVIIILYTAFYFYERICLTQDFENMVIEAVSVNQLWFFASSNLLCGLINITIKTLYLSMETSYMLLFGYCCMPTLVFAFIYKRRLFNPPRKDKDPKKVTQENKAKDEKKNK